MGGWLIQDWSSLISSIYASTPLRLDAQKAGGMGPQQSRPRSEWWYNRYHTHSHADSTGRGTQLHPHPHVQPQADKYLKYLKELKELKYRKHLTWFCSWSIGQLVINYRMPEEARGLDLRGTRATSASQSRTRRSELTVLDCFDWPMLNRSVKTKMMIGISIWTGPRL